MQTIQICIWFSGQGDWWMFFWIFVKTKYHHHPKTECNIWSSIIIVFDWKMLNHRIMITIASKTIINKLYGMVSNVEASKMCFLSINDDDISIYIFKRESIINCVIFQINEPWPSRSQVLFFIINATFNIEYSLHHDGSKNLIFLGKSRTLIVFVHLCIR